jgi:hypothetical protein
VKPGINVLITYYRPIGLCLFMIDDRCVVNEVINSPLNEVQIFTNSHMMLSTTCKYDGVGMQAKAC